MKKTTMQSLVAYLNGETVTNIGEIKAELVAELEKSEEKAAANRELYATMHDVVMAHLPTDKPMTVADLFTACEAELPEGAKKAKIQYALNNYWSGEVVKIENPRGANEYRRRA